MPDVLDCYRTLDLEPGASPERVRKAYIELAHVWHPDRYLGNPVLRQKAEERMREIEDAYQALKTFLPGLQRADETPRPIVKRLETSVTVEDTGWPLRYTIIALVFLTLLCVALFAVFLYLKGRALPAVIR
jgi:hypothetical protein